MSVKVASRAKVAFPEAPCALVLPWFEDGPSGDSPLLDEADAEALERLREKGLVRGKPQVDNLFLIRE